MASLQNPRRVLKLSFINRMVERGGDGITPKPA